MRVKIEIIETLSKIIQIDASTEEEALVKSKQLYNNEEYILNSNNLVETEFLVYKDNIEDEG